jgi:lipopolysaccharide biosynthesis glycosyltransferase
MDCDMLMLDDVAKLWALRDENYAVMCVKHNHVPAEATKFHNEEGLAEFRKPAELTAT